ncbi:hypothetical protein J2Z18_006043 [Paenibacillus lactis]|uniref:Uncharacterized protein n=1 Tax=Paenibacillus lactis TaxID=228574 RepID=A0ABS4FKW4_9BACL|nr:hypothetical protein [Paenibacillus lactis]
MTTITLEALFHDHTGSEEALFLCMITGPVQLDRSLNGLMERSFSKEGYPALLTDLSTFRDRSHSLILYVDYKLIFVHYI